MKAFSQFQIEKGRKIYALFNLFNSFSFALVTGNSLTLYALYLGASNVTIGLISSFNFFSFFALPLGRLWAKHAHVMKVYFTAWLIRGLMLIIMLPIPFFVSRGNPEFGILLVTIGTMMYNFFRGIGIVAANPVINDLAPGKDRGSFVVFISLICNSATLAAMLVLAFVLAVFQSGTAFSLAIILGIITSLTGSFFLYQMPLSKRDPDEIEKRSTFVKNFSEILRDSNFKLFLTAFSVIGFGVGMARPFIIVYCREVYGLSNSLVTIISFFSSVGAIAMGMITRLFIDKIGAKPMYLIFSIASLVSLIPAVIAPSFPSALIVTVFLCGIAFASNLGFTGEENAAQTYFFTIVPRKSLMDLSMVYYIILGVTGAVGSIFGGVILESLLEGGLSQLASYRIFFGIQIIIIGVAVFLQLRLQTMGSFELKNVIPLLFSLRDIKALNLLYKLEHTADSAEQTELLTELQESTSAVVADNLVHYLKSPRFSVRAQALNSIERLPKINAQVINALIEELDKGKNLTAHKAARILGDFKIKKASEKLTESIYSDDYILAGESMVALARIGDTKAQGLIGEIAVKTKNQHTLLWAVQAMQIYANPASVLLLADLLRQDFDNDVVYNEIILAFSNILGIEKRFYKSYTAYLEGSSSVQELLIDLYDETMSKKSKSQRAIPIHESILSFIEDTAKSEEFAQMFVRSKDAKGTITAMILSSIFDTDLIRLESYRFFLCAWMIMAHENKKLLLH